MGTGRQISIAEIREIFADLISNKRSREDISLWATSLMQAQDEGRLFYHPQEAEDIIWEAIKYLIGVDLKILPDTYLHGTEDFEQYVRDHLSKTE